MQAQDIMVNRVYKVKENDTVRAVIDKFIEYRISGLPIVNDRKIKKVPVEKNGVLAGIISRGDVIRNSFKTLV